jgi:hypothetical protein
MKKKRTLVAFSNQIKIAQKYIEKVTSLTELQYLYFITQAKIHVQEFNKPSLKKNISIVLKSELNMTRNTNVNQSQSISKKMSQKKRKKEALVTLLNQY